VSAGLADALVVAIDDSDVSPGVLGFLVVAALGVATWLLLRSMRRQMKKVDFDEHAADPPPAQPLGDAAPPPPEPQ
jgi:hypothetical protein